jgi:hypothetical protein
MERSFWSSVTINPPLYGADTPQSFFDDKLPFGWNLRNLGCLLQTHDLPSIPGARPRARCGGLGSRGAAAQGGRCSRQQQAMADAASGAAATWRAGCHRKLPGCSARPGRPALQPGRLPGPAAQVPSCRAIHSPALAHPPARPPARPHAPCAQASPRP